ncbi:hypothetical protein DK846_06680 [Methanospirillum lacunae]|uniref:PAS domain-containing protein n=2 Tax=Methanospirillum lacunae TaxID=668570 RepID=A0A2V2N4G4_9EURY|nr:hypothetical protein DK846_06680 [Methanospirillum lacunae]
MGVDIGEYINMLDHPVVLVDEDMQILCANQEINKISQNEATSAIGHLGGEVFECDYARCPGGCGKSTHCSGCVIRNSVKETYQTGKSVDKRPATIEKEIQGNCVPVNIFISTRKTGDVVLLQVEESQENVSSQDCDSDL